MHHRLREILLIEQDLLTREQGVHGLVFYFSRELTTARKGLREFHIPANYKDSNQSYKHLMDLFNEQHISPPNIQSIYGKAGIGKTHRINKEYKTDDTSCFSINDKLNLSLLISSFLSFNSSVINHSPSIFFNISVHAPFEILNRTLFSLFICGSLNDPTSGLIFSLPHTEAWKFIIEVPYSDLSQASIRENFNQIVPIISVISPSTLEEVTDENYKLFISKEEELVARFLKAFQDGTINRMVETTKTGEDKPVSFEPLTDTDECRSCIYNCIEKYAPNLPKNKIYELSFTKFLYRRACFFKGHYYCWNQSIERLGSIAMQQMINEAISLTKVNFQDSNYPRVYFVYDPGFSLHLLHTDWYLVPNDLKTLFKNENNDEDEAELLNQRSMLLPILSTAEQQAQNNAATDDVVLKDIKQSLKNHQLKKTILYHIWRTILSVAAANATASQENLMKNLHDYVTNELVNYPLISSSCRLQELLQHTSSSAETSIEIFKEYLFHSQTKPIFYRLLLHPGVSEEQLVEFMAPISQLARDLTEIEIVVFFDEVNTASCLGLFKEMFMDGTLCGKSIPKNIFFTAAINPYMKIEENTEQIHRTDYIVHELPESLKYLKVSYGALESKTLADYIVRKIAMFQVNSSANNDKTMPLERYAQETLSHAILTAQEFCEKYLGHNSVSQREIQRCFSLINFFWTLRYDHELNLGKAQNDPNPIRCIALSIALTYYFRLPTKEDNLQRNDKKSPSREQLAELLCEAIPNFDYIVQSELEQFVNTNNFVIPQGVAINQAVREHIFSIVVSIVTRTALCIIGVPGQSKTLSFQIVLQNLQGAQLSTKPFCKRLPAVDPFFCLGSKYSRSEDIAFIFDRAIKREQQYEQNRMNTRCVVFLDEASLPDEKKMVLKVLHPYLDECKVAFVAVANKAFDAANANLMICIYRSLPSEDDQKILAYGCLGLQLEQQQSTTDDRLDRVIYGLCQGYRRVLRSPDTPHIFHDRDFIYM
ncbi:unnamed protein product, partial [Rotaria sp. Silwood2]